MRRDKTLKICANHFVTPWMELKPNCGSDRAWVWSVLADFADETLKPELLAIRFANAESKTVYLVSKRIQNPVFIIGFTSFSDATMWKEAFEKAKKIVGSECEIYAGKTGADDQKDDSSSDVSYSDVSYCESSDNENQTIDSKDVIKDDEKEGDVEEENKTDKDTKEVEGQLEKLSVKSEDVDQEK